MSMRWFRVALLAAVVAGLLVGGVLAAGPPVGKGNGGDRAQSAADPASAGKVTMCHRTGSSSNPYVKITVSQNAVKAHVANRDMVIAADGTCPTTATSTTTRGSVSPGTTAPTADRVTICHRTKSKTKPYVKIRVSRRAAKAHLRHTGDTVIAADGTCPSTASPLRGKTIKR